MTSEEQAEIIKKIAENHVIVKKGAVWSIIGGAIAFTVAVGVVSWQSAKLALQDHVSLKAIAEIQALRDQARIDTQVIASARADMENHVVDKLTVKELLVKDNEGHNRIHLTATDQQPAVLITTPEGFVALRLGTYDQRPYVSLIDPFQKLGATARMEDIAMIGKH